MEIDCEVLARSLRQLPCSGNRFVAATNEKASPFHWTKDSDTIIAAAGRGHQAVDFP